MANTGVVQMTYRSSASFAVGGVSWLDDDRPVIDPPGGWRCYHCNEHFTGWRAAQRHFGAPGSKDIPGCVLEQAAFELAEFADVKETRWETMGDDRRQYFRNAVAIVVARIQSK